MVIRKTVAAPVAKAMGPKARAAADAAKAEALAAKVKAAKKAARIAAAAPPEPEVKTRKPRGPNKSKAVVEAPVAAKGKVAPAAKATAKAVNNSGMLNLTIVKKTEATDIKVIPGVAYVADGVYIPHGMVVAVAGKAIYHKVQVALGLIVEIMDNKGTAIYVLEDGTKVASFDSASIGISNSANVEVAVAEVAAKPAKAKVVVVEDDDEEEEESDDEEDDEFEEEAPKAKAKPAAKGKKAVVVEEDDDEEEDDSDSDDEEEDDSDSEEESDDEEDDDAVDEDDEEDEDPENGDEEEDDEDAESDDSDEDDSDSFDFN